MDVNKYIIYFSYIFNKYIPIINTWKPETVSLASRKRLLIYKFLLMFFKPLEKVSGFQVFLFEVYKINKKYNIVKGGKKYYI